MVKTFIVTGMHRSATSLIAQALHEHGVHMGSDLISSRDSHPHDFYEHRPIVALHKDILDSLGVDTSLGVPSRRRVLDAFDKRSDRADSIIEHEQNNLWGFKDPRTSLTLEGWVPRVENPHIISIFREPLRVAESLERTEDIPIDDGLSIAKQYNNRLLDSLERVVNEDTWSDVGP